MKDFLEKIRKRNPWGTEKEKFSVGFVRHDYVEKIQKFSGNALIKVLIGQRRSGKSFIMRQIIHSLISPQNSSEISVTPAENIFYFNSEWIDCAEINTSAKLLELIELYKSEIQPKGKIFLFLDEIQEIKGWEKLVNSFSQEFSEEYEIFITGSNSTLLSGELATYLSGRYISFEIFPFSFSEYREFLGLSSNKESYLKYLDTGGIPQLLSLPTEESQRQYMQALQDTILLRDIIHRYSIKNSVFLEKLFLFLADNIGNLFSIKSIVDYAKSQKTNITHDTISHYLQYLCQSFLVHEVPRFDIKGKSILSGKKKFYINDIAFRNFLSSGFDTGRGKHLENMLYIFFRQKGYKISVGDVAGKEIDFILEKEGKTIYVQVAHSLLSDKVISREFGNLEKIKDFHKKVVISLDDRSFGNKNGIEHLLAWEIEKIFQ